MCTHQPPCPAAGDGAWAAARVVASYPHQGWSLLCNGVVAFDDNGALLPDGTAVPAHRPAVSRSVAATLRRDRGLTAAITRIAAAQAAGTPLGLRRAAPFRRGERRHRLVG